MNHCFGKFRGSKRSHLVTGNLLIKFTSVNISLTILSHISGAAPISLTMQPNLFSGCAAQLELQGILFFSNIELLNSAVITVSSYNNCVLHATYLQMWLTLVLMVNLHLKYNCSNGILIPVLEVIEFLLSRIHCTCMSLTKPLLSQNMHIPQN